MQKSNDEEISLYILIFAAKDTAVKVVLSDFDLLFEGRQFKTISQRLAQQNAPNDIYRFSF